MTSNAAFQRGAQRAQNAITNATYEGQFAGLVRKWLAEGKTVEEISRETGSQPHAVQMVVDKLKKEEKD